MGINFLMRRIVLGVVITNCEARRLLALLCHVTHAATCLLLRRSGGNGDQWWDEG